MLQTIQHVFELTSIQILNKLVKENSYVRLESYMGAYIQIWVKYYEK